MLIFLAIAVGSFILLTGSFLFGHDHDGGHGDGGHADSHDIGHDAEPTIGFFSMKVIGTLTMGFGAAGAIARYYGADYLVSSLWGLGNGLVLAGIMYLILKMIYSQQASSLVQTATVVGQTGLVTTSIEKDGKGEVGVNVGGQYMTYLAKSAGGRPIAKGRSIRVINAVGGELVVEETSK
jgi:membrane-bound ClpP family serine protease